MTGRKLHPAEKAEMITCKVDGGIKRQFQEMVERDGLTISQVVRLFIERFVELKGGKVRP